LQRGGFYRRFYHGGRRHLSGQAVSRAGARPSGAGQAGQNHPGKTVRPAQRVSLKPPKFSKASFGFYKLKIYLKIFLENPAEKDDVLSRDCSLEIESGQTRFPCPVRDSQQSLNRN